MNESWRDTILNGLCLIAVAAMWLLVLFTAGLDNVR